MTICPDDECNEELQKQKDLLHCLTKNLEQVNKDVSVLCSYVDRLKAMISQRTKEKLKIHSKTLGGFSSLRNQKKDNHLIVDNLKGDGDAGAFFPCPFCYVDIEVFVLCSHLQQEHCFDLKNAVCPLCASNLGNDAIGHFMVQHSHSLKRRQKSKKSGFCPTSSAGTGKELRDLSTSLGQTSRNDRTNANESAADPLISPFLCTISLSDPKDNHTDRDSSNDDLVTSDVKSTESSTLDGGHEQDPEERRQKSEFVQQLIFSTIF